LIIAHRSALRRKAGQSVLAFERHDSRELGGEWMASLRNVLPRWYSIVFVLRMSAAAISLFAFPSATSCAMCSSCGTRPRIPVDDEGAAPAPRLVEQRCDRLQRLSSAHEHGLNVLQPHD
jgi:hypothetical protein